MYCVGLWSVRGNVDLEGGNGAWGGGKNWIDVLVLGVYGANCAGISFLLGTARESDGRHNAVL
jgi:hypothetical protein